MFKRFNKKVKSTSEDLPVDADSSLVLVKKLISGVFENLDSNSIQLETELEYLGLDSIKFLNILLGFQDAFEMDLDDIVEMVDLSKLHKVRDLVNLADEFKRSKNL
jgi:acyl carrier protein